MILTIIFVSLETLLKSLIFNNLRSILYNLFDMVPMQGQRGAVGSFPETLAFEHGSTSSDVVNSPSNRLPDYISLNPTNQEGQNVSMWDVGEPSSSSGPNQANLGHIESRPDHGWPSLMKPCPEPPSSVLSLGDHGASSSSFSDPFDTDDHRLSRKRKAVELTMGQSSSGAGSSSMFQRSDGGSSSWHTIDENPLPDPTIPRLGLSIGENPLVSRQQVDSRGSDVSGLRLNQPSDDLSSHQGQPVLRVPALRRNFQSTSRWSRSSSSRATRSPNLVISADRSELDSISDHPIFPPPSSIRTAAQTELNWSSTGDGANVNDGGNVGSSRARPSSGPSPNYNPRRLSAFLRRSLLSAAGSEDGGGQNGNIFPIIPPALNSSSSSSQDVGTLPGHHRHQAYSRSSLLLGRQLEGAYLSRTVTPGGEGRGRLVSEIRNVLDLMRRGEALRFEDVMILDQSVFYGIADIHDRHRDMRLDIDNMSYEELLALEERIGNVNTGLTEETIAKHLKQKSYVVERGQPDVEPCSVCQEEYKDGDDLGTLECGHDFHHGCIKQWLQHKNLCPICKSTGFAST
ncbi:putative transcription factor C2H2 family [Helianthus annuus]|uniref:RING-type E3 ubiquitin transferase n=2 Tax=Helianthus annuus TaxID=4232 RepID=A0A9K3JLS4_HELAN|nr:putative transcription factor C2H2 family [Helianthus annuus]